LANFGGSSINFIKEEDYRLITGRVKPLRSEPLGNILRHLGKPQKVTFGHLRGTTLHYRQATLRSNLVDKAGFADTMPTAKKYWKTSVKDERNGRKEGFEINRHIEDSVGWVLK
jgi:hypothetical protein